ncbi:MAG TPA: hypothetical protein VFQ41_09570 [Candidatus Angelobacter sp.]|nr:hypothetical protein [Candidatus Angelobacter sp.]
MKQNILPIYIHSSATDFSSRISEGLHARIAEQRGEVQLQQTGQLSIGATRAASCKKFVKAPDDKDLLEGNRSPSVRAHSKPATGNAVPRNPILGVIFLKLSQIVYLFLPSTNYYSRQ